MSNVKELYHCQNCKLEFWLTIEESMKKGSLCPNKCERHKLICLGETEEEIERKREFFFKDVFNFEPINDGYQEDSYKESGGKKGNSYSINEEEDASAAYNGLW